MRSLPIGFICITLVMLYAIGGANNWMIYANMHSIVIVIGGTIAISLLAIPWEVLKGIGHDLAGLSHSEQSIESLGADLKTLSKTKTLPQKSKDALINRAIELWEKGVSQELFLSLLNQTKIDLDQLSADSIQGLRNLSKYPPALGMAGTVMGLVTLFSNLTTESKAALGPALALAMTATFFGLIVTNMILTPLVDRLQVKQMRQRRHLTKVYQILCLIHRGEALVMIEEEISERAIPGSGGQREAA
jgi:chemotaxis protein MotA